jgi:hypothetical protein
MKSLQTGLRRRFFTRPLGNIIAVVAGVLLFQTGAQAQFTGHSPAETGLPRILYSQCAWGDFDNDGFLDLAVIGEEADINTHDPTLFRARIYRNNHNGTFTDINTGLDPVYFGSVTWGDYNNDGRLDLLLSGADSVGEQVTKLYQNNGDGTFTNAENLVGQLVTNTADHKFHSASYGCVTFGDYDNDGYLDVLLCGFNLVNGNAELPVTVLYHNNRNGTFSEISTPNIPGVNGEAKIAWGDFDNDGYQDFAICGRTTGVWDFPNPITKVFHNNKGNGTFSEVTASPMAGVCRGVIAWGDFNNDGLLDLLVAGQLNGDSGSAFGHTRDTIVIYRNMGNGTFNGINTTGLPALGYANASVGDYDGDGRLDLLLNGYGSSEALFHNDGNFSFSAENLTGTELAEGAVAFGDINNDGYLDAITTGVIVGSSRDTTMVYLNAQSGTSSSYLAHSKPNAPTALTANISGTHVTLGWAKATGTNANAFSYNVRIGVVPHGIDRISPLSDTSAGVNNGFRRVARLGNVNLVNSYTVDSLTPGAYYWSVQTIDASFAGSSFATEGTFSFGLNKTVKVYLQGPYVTAGDSMSRNLKTGGYLASHFSVPIPAMAVDSINIEIRDSSAASKALTRKFRPAWLLTNGTIRAFADTTKPYVTYDSTTAGKYYIVVRHRNHLEIMSAAADTVDGRPAPVAYDFSTGQAAAFGTNPMKALGTKFGLFAGNGNGDAAINATDRNAVWRVQNGLIGGYFNGDFDLNGIVNATDQNGYWRVNNGAISQVP